MSEDEKILMQLEQEWSLEKVYQQELENREKIGIKKGIKKGLKQSVEEGRKEGIEEGIHLKQISTVKKLLERGMSIKDIAEIEEITEEEVIKIQEEL